MVERLGFVSLLSLQYEYYSSLIFHLFLFLLYDLFELDLTGATLCERKATPEASGLGPGTRNVSAAMAAFALATSNSGASSPSPSSPRRVHSNRSNEQDNNGINNSSSNTSMSGSDSSSNDNSNPDEDPIPAPSLAEALAAKKPTLVNQGSNDFGAKSAGATSSTKGHSGNSSDQVQNLLGVGAGGRGDVWLCDARYRLAVSELKMSTDMALLFGFLPSIHSTALTYFSFDSLSLSHIHTLNGFLSFFSHTFQYMF